MNKEYILNTTIDYMLESKQLIAIMGTYYYKILEILEENKKKDKWIEETLEYLSMLEGEKAKELLIKFEKEIN